MQIELNGEKREVADQIALAELISALALAPERVASNSIRRWYGVLSARYHDREGDRIEIVHSSAAEVGRQTRQAAGEPAKQVEY